MFIGLTKKAIAIKEKMPNKNEIVPTNLGKVKSVLSTLKGYPSVVIIKSLVIATEYLSTIKLVYQIASSSAHRFQTNSEYH